MPAPLSATVRATQAMPSAGAKGSSPCRLTTMASSAQPAIAAHSARRSVPEACPDEVIATCTPRPCRASAMRWSSVATQTSRAPAASARRATCRTIGSPPIGSNGLPGKRVEAWRAGMATTNSGTVMPALSTTQLLIFPRPLRKRVPEGRERGMGVRSPLSRCAARIDLSHKGRGENQARRGKLAHNATQNASGSRASAGTACQPGCAKPRHFTASFSVISTGNGLPKAKSPGP